MNPDELADLSQQIYNSERPPRIINNSKRYEVLQRQKWRCNNCNTKLKYNINSVWDGKVAHIDHIHPYSDAHNYPNGVFNINESINLQALCPDCNLKKGRNKQ